MPPRLRKLTLLIALVGTTTVALAAPEIRRGPVDPLVRFSDGSLSLLVSQSGYADPGIRSAFLMASDRSRGDSVASFSVEDSTGTAVATGVPEYAGAWVTAHFWRLDLSALKAPGEFRIRAGGLTSQLFPVRVPRELWFDPLIPDVVFNQLAARRRNDALGGFIDSGNDIRETNSHSVLLIGLLDLVERHENWLDAVQIAGIESFIDHGWRFLVAQQEPGGRFLGGWDRGTPITDGMWPNHFRACHALTRIARHYRIANPPLAAALLDAVRLAESWTRAGFDPAAEHSAFLLGRIQSAATWHLESGDSDALADARAAARELLSRQVDINQPTPNGLYGLFRETSAGSGWCRLNHHDFGIWTGAYDELPLDALAALLAAYPGDPDAPGWRALARDFATGFLLGSAARSPLGLVANGEYPDVSWFSDLFHGMSMTYALAAASALEFESALDRPTFADFAERQLLWIAGLNTGFPFPNGAEPFSCMVGHGYQWLRDGHGSFPDIPGSIVNGVSATPQFVKTMPTGPEQPLHACDESWISHTGAWLSASARLLCSRLRVGGGLTLASVGADVEFSWPGVGGATGYRLRRDPAANGDFSTLAAAIPGATRVTLPLDPGPLVFYRVAGEGGSCEGPR